MQTYLRAGESRAYALGNRGPIRFTQTGALHPEILESYSRCGFYVFESVLRHSELADIERDLHDIRERLPVEHGAAVDGKGRPALDCKAPVLHWAWPLSDPWGGTAGGIHNAAATYDEARIRERARLIGYAIDARRQRFPDEAPFAYQPHVEAGLSYR